MFLLPTLGSLHVLKCGDLDAAQSVFNGVAMRTVVSWNSMIAACACLEGFIEIIDCFLHMCHEEVRPDVGTIPSLLSSCAHPKVHLQGTYSILAVLGQGLIRMHQL